jgi:peptide deformylase
LRSRRLSLTVSRPKKEGCDGAQCAEIDSSLRPINVPNAAIDFAYWIFSSAASIFRAMARLPILEFPDPRLRTKAAPVAEVDASIRKLIDDMFETMYAAPGIGLAATQVNVHKRVIVIDISEDRSAPIALINPEIVSREGTEETEEGCLSVPGIYDKVTRSEKIRVRTLDRSGKQIEMEADGLLAVCIQHELDHLEGKLFVDYLSELKRTRIRKKLEKERKDKAVDTRAKAKAPAI